jgi:hypothetical protein
MEKAEQPPHRGHGRVGYIIDIASDQQHIGGLHINLFQQPVQEGIVFGLPVVAVQLVAQMPVGGVDHG